MEKLVSIITPCYNGGKYIDAYAKSLVKQNYSNCQIIFVDDGSEDNSKEKIFSYKTKFEEKGYSFEYHFQKNSGQAAAIATGLIFVKGDYFIWPDVDDVLPENSIKRKVDFLEKNLDYGLVRTDCKVVEERNLTNVVEHVAQKFRERNKENLFIDYLLGQNMWLQPGCYMIRTTAFLRANPDKYIYKSRAGQNWQVLLPVLYYFKCAYLDEPLYVYILHKGSHSDQSFATYEDKVKKSLEYEELIIKTLEHMDIKDQEKYCSLVRGHYAELRLSLAFDHRNKKDAEKFYEDLVEEKNNSLRFKLKAKFADSYGVHSYIKLVRKIRKFLKSV